MSEVWCEPGSSKVFATRDTDEELACAICGEPVGARAFGVELPSGPATHNDCYNEAAESDTAAMAAFLRACYGEDEAWIRNFARLLNEVHLHNADTPEHRRASIAFVFGQERLDPGRLLCEVEAKRAILARYEDCLARMEDDDYPAGVARDQAREYEDFVLPNLAAEFSDRPGYRQEWKP